MCQPGHASATPAAVVRPRWSLLYGTTLPQIIALAAVEVTAPPHPARLLLRWGLALGSFLGIGLWLRANRAAFDLQDWCACAGETVTVRIIPSRRPARHPHPAADESINLVPAAQEYELVGH